MSGSTHNDGGPAFPRHYGTMSCGEKKEQLWSDGMTLRDYFAGQALVGMMANSYMIDSASPATLEIVSGWAFEAADAMLAAREKGAK